MEYNTKYIYRSKSEAKVLKNLISIFIFIIIIITIYNAFLVYVSKNSEKQEYIHGFKAYKVESNSMEPELKTGDVIIIKKYQNFKDLQAGEVVTFRNKGEVITHRIVEIDEEDQEVTTKGDKNQINDKDKITFEMLEGRMVLKLPGFGGILEKTQNIIYIILIFIMIITLYLRNKRIARKKIVRRIKKKKEDKRNEIEEDNKENY